MLIIPFKYLTFYFIDLFSCTHFHSTTPLCLAHNSLKRGWENSLKLKWVYAVLLLPLLLLLITTFLQQQQQQGNNSISCWANVAICCLFFGVVGVCRKGRHLSHSSRKHCLRRIFSTFVVVVWAAAAAQWVTHLTLTKTKISMQQQMGNNNNGQRIKCWVFRINWTHNMFVSSLYRIFSLVLFCPMPTELIAQIICFFGQSLKRLTSGELILSTMKICQKY